MWIYNLIIDASWSNNKEKDQCNHNPKASNQNQIMCGYNYKSFEYVHVCFIAHKDVNILLYLFEVLLFVRP